MSYDRTNTGIISKNDRKETDKHPDIKGYLNVEGAEYEVAGWQKRRGSDGAPFYSLRVKRKAAPAPVNTRSMQDTAGYGPKGGERTPPPALDDEIPF